MEGMAPRSSHDSTRQVVEKQPFAPNPYMGNICSHRSGVIRWQREFMEVVAEFQKAAVAFPYMPSALNAEPARSSRV